MAYYGWAPYVPVARRRAKALREMEKLRKKGKEIRPVEAFRGRKIARTFWGESWCSHLEAFSDYENRLPRGRTYVRNGSVCHLDIEKGRVDAIVSGSDLYEVSVSIKTMPKGKWDYIRKSCTGRIGSLLELLRGRFSDEVMRVVTDRNDGLFPLPGEMTFDCSCPDWAVMCKHVAAVLYGVGARLDDSPELIFKLRGVDHEELIGGEAIAAATAAGQSGGSRRRLKGDVASVFGVEVDELEGAAETLPSAKPVKNGKRGGKRSRTKTAKTAEQNVKGEPAKSGRRLLDCLTGRLIERIVDASGLTKVAFGNALGVSPNTISGWVYRTRGRINLSGKSRAAFERFLPDVDPDEAGRKGLGTDWARIASAIAEVAEEEDAKRERRNAKRSKNRDATPRPESAKPKRASTSPKVAKRKKKAASSAKSSTPKPITGKRVSSLRKRMGLSAAAFGKRIGVTAQTVYNWEKAKGALRLRPSSRDVLTALL